MTKIKSAIEIAMEKTKTLHLSPQEKERLKEEELQSKAHALGARFLEVDLPFREVEKELAKYSPEQRARLEKTMLQDLVEALDLDRDNDLASQGIEILAPGKKKTLRQVQELAEAYQKQKNLELPKTEKVLRNQLRAAGISGSAILPKVEESREWVDTLSAFRSSYESRLQSLKKEIK